MTISILSLGVNLLLIISFLVDRIFRIRSLKEYRDARDAQIVLLKERIDFIEKYNDDFLTEKHKKLIANLKLLIVEKEIEIDSSLRMMADINKLLEENSVEMMKFKSLYDASILKTSDLEESKKNLEDERTKLLEELTKSSFILSHELRAPLASCLAIIDLMKMDDMGSEYLELLLMSLNKMESSLIENMLALKKIISN